MALSQDDTCKAVGEKIAVHTFAAMLNPIYRGANFRWDNFLGMVERLTESQLYMSVNFSVKKQHVQLAKDSATRMAEQLLKMSGVHDDSF